MNRRTLYLPTSLFILLALLFFCVERASSSSMRHASLPPYTVSFSTSNFTLQTLVATADDLTDPQQARFSVRNGTRLWFGISLQSTPAGMQLLPADQNNDLVTTTFVNAGPLLPPSEVLPFDQGNAAHGSTQLRLKVAFSGPSQQVQVKLDPTDTHALTLDICDLLLHLLGQRQSGMQIGLLAPGTLQEVFNTTSNLRDFTTLVNDYSQLLAATSDQSTLLAQAYACAIDVVALLADPTEQVAIADVLWKIQGKAIPHASALKAVSDFTRTEAGLAVEGYLKNLALSYSTALLPQNAPTILLRTASPVTPTPTHTATPTLTPTHTPPAAPTASTSPTSPHVPSPATPATRPGHPHNPSPARRPRRTLTPTPTRSARPLPTATPTPPPAQSTPERPLPFLTPMSSPTPIPIVRPKTP